MKKVTKKKTIEPLKHSDSDLKRYIGALGEDFNNKFDTVIEQFGGMNDKIDGMDLRFDEINKRLDGVNQRLDRHEKKLDSHTEMIGNIMLRLQEVQSEMKQKVDLQQFARLEKRVVLLEARSRR